MDKTQAADDAQAQTTTLCAATVHAKEWQPRPRLARSPSRTALKGLVKLQERSHDGSSFAAVRRGGAKLARMPIAGVPVALVGDAPSTRL
jgi:hypothetical protein